jgi:intracellular sulfur oxidation DsrE/DsrF family protein
MSDDYANAVVLLFTTDGIGKTDDLSLQQQLTNTFFEFLSNSNMIPLAICFYTDGVKLTIEGSPILEHLRWMERRGVDLIICKSSLDAYGITDLVRVGVVSSITNIIEAMWKADRVITL